MALNNHQQFKRYVIADGYRWHCLTTDKREFKRMLDAYYSLMAKSGKDNTYTVMNLTMSRSEYEQAANTMRSNLEKNKPKKERKG